MTGFVEDINTASTVQI